MNELFTVVIPEHNRPERLKRLLDYYLFYNCNIIVTDSSDIRFKYADLYKQIYYVHYPKKHLAEKLVLIFDKIKTPYVVMCADDDYIIPSAIVRMVDFMKRHPEYRSAQGIYARYYPLENNSVFLEYPQMINNGLNDDSPNSRLSHLMSSYYQFYYAVFEKELFIESINSTIIQGKCKLQNLCLLELYLSMYGAICAKHAILPVLYCMREYISDSAGSYIPNLSNLVENQQSKDEIEYLIKKLSNLISDDIEKGKLVLKEALSLYLTKCNSNISIYHRLMLKLDGLLFDSFFKKRYHQYLLRKAVDNPDEMKKSIQTVKLSVVNSFKAVYGISFANG